jgi:hypothetical protein
VLAHPFDPAPGRLAVVRAGEASDNLDQVGALGFGQPILLRLRQEMQGGIVGRFADTGLRLRAGSWVVRRVLSR